MSRALVFSKSSNRAGNSRRRVPSDQPSTSSGSGAPICLETSGGPRARASTTSTDGSSETSSRSPLRDLGYAHLHLLCPICSNMLLPPIILCTNGHSVCDSCRRNCPRCPCCFACFSHTRNFFAEGIMNTCLHPCRYLNDGCRVTLFGYEMVNHVRICEYRPVECRRCKELVPYCEYLEHLRIVEKLGFQVSADCRGRFDIVEQQFLRGHFQQWNPIWLCCHDVHFFCFLERSNEYKAWWIWVGAHASTLGCQRFVANIFVWNATNITEVRFVGKVHPVRTPPSMILYSRQCLIVPDSTLRNLLQDGGIEVFVSVALAEPNQESGSSRAGARASAAERQLQLY